MYILDTDHISILDRSGAESQILLDRLATIPATQFAVTIISYEEQMRGWLSYVTKAQTIEKQVLGYRQLRRQLMNYCTIPVVEFDLACTQEFQRLRKLYPRLGTMDLKIAAIALVNQSTLLTRNSIDFEQILGLIIEDWTRFDLEI
jgi:tRNA(fMet)-specific endonuclease VapC